MGPARLLFWAKHQHPRGLAASYPFQKSLDPEPSCHLCPCSPRRNMRQCSVPFQTPSPTIRVFCDAAKNPKPIRCRLHQTKDGLLHPSLEDVGYSEKSQGRTASHEAPHTGCMYAQRLRRRQSTPRMCAKQAGPAKQLTAMSRTQPIMTPDFDGCAEHAIS